MTEGLSKNKGVVLGFTGGASGKNLTCQFRRHKRHGFYPWVGKSPWRRKWQPTLVFLPGEFQEQKSLVGYSPGVAKSPAGLSDRTKQHIKGAGSWNYRDWEVPRSSKLEPKESQWYSFSVWRPKTRPADDKRSSLNMNLKAGEEQCPNSKAVRQGEGIFP